METDTYSQQKMIIYLRLASTGIILLSILRGEISDMRAMNVTVMNLVRNYNLQWSKITVAWGNKDRDLESRFGAGPNWRKFVCVFSNLLPSSCYPSLGDGDVVRLLGQPGGYVSPSLTRKAVFLVLIMITSQYLL